MSPPPIVDSYMIDSLERKTGTARVQAGCAPPTLGMQLKSLAELYEADIDRLMRLQYAITAAASITSRAIRIIAERAGGRPR